MLYWNTQSILNKLDYINSLLEDLNVNILCLTEHWLSKDELFLLKIPGYYLVSFYCRNHGQHGGSAIFVRDNILTRNVSTLCNLSSIYEFEMCCTYIESYNVVCVVFYRAPNRNKVKFGTFLDNLIICLTLFINLNLM